MRPSNAPIGPGFLQSTNPAIASRDDAYSGLTKVKPSRVAAVLCIIGQGVPQKRPTGVHPCYPVLCSALSSAGRMTAAMVGARGFWRYNSERPRVTA